MHRALSMMSIALVVRDHADRRAAGVQAEIDRACTHASYLGEADDISILASLRHSF